MYTLHVYRLHGPQISPELRYITVTHAAMAQQCVPVCAPSVGVWDPTCKATSPVLFGGQGAWVPPSRALCTAAPMRLQSGGVQVACPCDLEAAMPWPKTPLVGSASGSPAYSLEPETPGTHDLPKAPTLTHTGTMLASTAHQRYGVVHGGCPSPLGLGTGQPGIASQHILP